MITVLKSWIDSYFQIPCVTEIMKHLSFVVWFNSLSSVTCGSIHYDSDNISSLSGWVLFHCVCHHIVSMHLVMSRYLSWFHFFFLWIVHQKMVVQFTRWINFPHVHMYTVVGLLYYGSFIFLFWQVYFHSNSDQEFPFSPYHLPTKFHYFSY